MIRSLVVMFVTLPLLLAADGYRVRKWLTPEEITAGSPYIFTAVILKTDHVFAEREAYGRKHRYVVRYRLLARIEKVLKGDAQLWRAMGKEPGPVWLEQYGHSVPGKWVLVDELYRNGIAPGQLTGGMRCLVYAAAINDLVVQIRGLDPVAKTSATEALLKKTGP